MTPADRLRFTLATLIIVLWAGAILGVYGKDQDVVNAITPVALAAATFLFASPLWENRRTRAKPRPRAKPKPKPSEAKPNEEG